MTRISRYGIVFFIISICFTTFSFAATQNHWRFEGTIDSNIVSVTDIVGGKEVSRLEGIILDPNVSLTFGTPAPLYGVSSSAFFDNVIPNEQRNTGICLMRPDDDDLDFASVTGFTIEAFVKPLDNRQAVVVRDYNYTNNNHGYWIDTTNDGKDFTFRMGNGTVTEIISSGYESVIIDDWQHVAGTWDGATMRIYVDGIEKNSTAYSGGLTDNPGAFAIGAIVRHSGDGGTNNEGQYFRGYIDEVRISDAALEPAQFLNAASVDPYVQFVQTNSMESEDALYAEIEVEMVGDNDLAASVSYEVIGGSATNGDDYILSTGTLIFAPHQIVPEIIDVLIFDDNLVEGAEDVLIRLYDPVNCVLGFGDEHTFSIFDDESLPQVQFAVTESQGSESITPVYVTVELSEPISYQTSVDYAVVGGTATNGNDYVLAAGTLVFDELETSKKIQIDVLNDGYGEGEETIILQLSNPDYAVLGPNTQFTYTIIDTYINSFSMEFVFIPRGDFQMGSTSGDFDEQPVHDVTVTPFMMSAYEVTNAQYEQFDPDHALVDHRGFTHEPNEAVIFVSWEDANAFCAWLSIQEGQPYRLATEAEWEYACRAGTTTKYYTGDTLPEEFFKNQSEQGSPVPVSLNVGNGYANAFGLFDMHGNVEEWCYDYYGPYDSNDRTDPIQLSNNTGVRVARGGSHSTTTYYLRSANRMGTTADDAHWMLGFRVVLDHWPEVEQLPEPPLSPYQLDVSQDIPADINDAPDPCVPYFYGPRKYVWIPPELNGGPLYTNHNHVPGIAECPNGDMLTVWYSTTSETARLLNIAMSRLRYGEDQWEDASVFWNAPDRNDHAPQIWLDEETGTLYHFNGISQSYSWNNLATMMRTSTDNGVTWSQPRLIMPTHDYRHMPIESVFRASNGDIILPCDAVPGGAGGTAIWISPDNAATWYDPGAGQPNPSFVDGGTGAWVAGIHAGVAELTDGKLLAFGRGNSINGMMPKSVSSDWGYNWTYSASEFPPIGGGQRLVLIRLREGPLFFASFGANGLFGSLSFDDGETWTNPRLITDDGPGTPVETSDGSIFTMSADNAEPRGYLSVCQARNGLIHLISSRQHYVFNMKYIKNDYVPSYEPNDLALFSDDWLKSDDYITQTAGTTPDGNDLLLHYNFDEESGDTAHDQSDNIYDGNVVGAANWQWPSYDDSGCLSFNDDTAIVVPPAVTGTLTDQVTVSVWLNGYNSSGRDNVVFETGADGLYLRAIVPTIPLQVEFQAGDDVNDVLVWTDSNSADWEGIWRHYAFVKNGSNMRIYRDGELVAEKTDAWPNLDGIQNQTFDIGAFISHSNDYKGKMDEFRIYDYALTDDEILYLAKTATFYIPLDSDWDFFQDGIINFKDYAIMTQTWESASS